MSTAKYPLQDLVMVRGFRATAAAREVSVAKKKLELAREAVVSAQETLADYKIWRVDEENRSYDRIINKQVTLEKLEEQKQEIRSLREKQADYEQAILDAEKQVGECEQALQQALDALREAERDLRKLEEHREVWDTEQAEILERKEEDEMDDFRAPPALKIG